jgi:polar amino acid transport system substrate-binding protein
VLPALLLPAGSARAQRPAPKATELRVATRIVPPFVLEDQGHLTGFSIELWQSIAAQLGVTSRFLVEPNVVDLLAAVRSGSADVGIAAISITAERGEALDFTQPMFESGLQIMVRGRREAAGRSPIRGLLTLLLSPVMFQWLGIVLLFILVPAHIVWLAERRHKEGIIPTEAYFPGIFHAAWWAAGTLATQADAMPRSVLARLMAVLWMFTGVVFVAYFTAQVTASLTVQQLRGSIQGPDDLPGRRVLRHHHAAVREVVRLEDAYHALLREDVDAVVFDAPVLLYYAAHEGKGKVQIVGPVFRKENYGMVCRNQSPWRKRLDTALLTLRENGTYEQLYDKWFRGK